MIVCQLYRELANGCSDTLQQLTQIHNSVPQSAPIPVEMVDGTRPINDDEDMEDEEVPPLTTPKEPQQQQQNRRTEPVIEVDENGDEWTVVPSKKSNRPK